MEKSRDAFRTISEVAEWLDVPTHVLRFWESRFSQIKPVKRAGGRRYYRPSDMRVIGGVKTLLHDQGMTIRGVQKLFREQGIKHVTSFSPALDGEDADDLEIQGDVIDHVPSTAPEDAPSQPIPAAAARTTRDAEPAPEAETSAKPGTPEPDPEEVPSTDTGDDLEEASGSDAEGVETEDVDENQLVMFPPSTRNVPLPETPPNEPPAVVAAEPEIAKPDETPPAPSIPETPDVPDTDPDDFDPARVVVPSTSALLVMTGPTRLAANRDALRDAAERLAQLRDRMA